jgi:hypothetical protein
MTLEEQKLDLIDIILFYRDEYDIGNEEYYDLIIDNVMNAENESELEVWARLIDDWL